MKVKYSQIITISDAFDSLIPFNIRDPSLFVEVTNAERSSKAKNFLVIFHSVKKLHKIQFKNKFITVKIQMTKLS